MFRSTIDRAIGIASKQDATLLHVMDGMQVGMRCCGYRSVFERPRGLKPAARCVPRIAKLCNLCWLFLWHEAAALGVLGDAAGIHKVQEIVGRSSLHARAAESESAKWLDVHL